MLGFIGDLSRRLLDVALPQSCFLCGAHAGAVAICAACADALPRLSCVCPVCAVDAGQGRICGRCQVKPPAFDRSEAVLAYGFPVDRMVQALKYRHRLALSRWFGEALAVAERPAGDVVIVPMPLHAKRLRERGFNQAVEIARPLARAWGVPLELDGVERVRDTRPQADLPWAERGGNIRGAFRCTREFAGAVAVVVDDVMTTGATLDELARTLKRHGASRVENLVLARTPSPN